MKPYGLVLAGGGGKGAYQIGAWKAMREIGVTFNAVAGVSIGSINGALVVADDFRAAEEMWNNISLDKGVKIENPLPDPENLFSMKNWGVLLKEFVKNKGLDASPVNDFLAPYINEEKVRSAKIPFGIVTVQMSQGNVGGLELFLKDIPEGQLLDYLLASSNIPLATNIGPEGERFLDGGIYDNTPVTMLRRSGYNRLVVVDISSIKGINHNLDFQNCEVIYIRPYDIDDLGASFDFDSETIEKRKMYGYLDAKKAFSYLLGKIYYFKPEVFRSMVEKYGFKAVSQLEDLAHDLKVDRLFIYEEQDFLEKTKLAFEKRKKEQQELDMEIENQAAFSSERDHKYSFIRRFVQRRSDNEFRDAIAVLDNIIL